MNKSAIGMVLVAAGFGTGIALGYRYGRPGDRAGADVDASPTAWP